MRLYNDGKKAGVSRKIKLWIIAIIICILSLLGGGYLIEFGWKPSVMAIAEFRMNTLATNAVYHTIENNIEIINNVDEMVNIKHDDDGKIVFVQANTLKMNQLAGTMAIQIQEELNKISNEEIVIPIGQVFGNHLFANIGPSIKINLLPVGTVKAEIKETMEQAGINQIKRSFYLAAEAKIKIVVPLDSKETIINVNVPILEYIIVGSVPNTYLDINN